MEKIAFILEDNGAGGVNIKYREPEGEKPTEHLLVPRGQSTEFYCDGPLMTLKLAEGNVFVLLDEGAAPLIFFVWKSNICKTSEQEVVALCRHHSMPIPFSIVYEGGVPQLDRREWMII